MKNIIFFCYIFLLSGLIFLNESCNPAQAGQQEQYQCTPCGSDCDKATYTAAGECRECHMALVKKSTVKIQSVAAADICDYIKKHPDAVLLDVRTKEEFEGRSRPNYGTLKNAINIPIQELESKLSTISHLKNKEVLVFCSHSHRSPRAGYMLTQNGFTNVTNMDGGMSVMKDKACKQ